MDVGVSRIQEIERMLERREEFQQADCALRDELVHLQAGQGGVEDSMIRFLAQVRAYDRYSATILSGLRALRRTDAQAPVLPNEVEAALDAGTEGPHDE